MGRPRKHNRHLPPRFYLRRGSYYFAHPDGRWIPLGKNQAEAFRKYGEHMASALDGTTMAAVFARFRLEEIPKLTKSGQRSYLQSMPRLERVFGHMAPTSIKAQHAYQYLDERKSSPFAANREVQLLGRVMRKAVRWGYIEWSPITRIERHSEPARKRYVTREEFEAVHAIAKPVIQVAMDLAVLTGLRLTNVLGLTLSDCRTDGLHCGKPVKDGKPMVFGWTPALREVVDRAKQIRRIEMKAKKAHREPNTLLLLTTRNERGFTSSGFQTAWQRLMRAAVARSLVAESFRFHDLRAVAADRSKDPVRLLGHATGAVTARHYLRGPIKVEPTE